MSIEDLFVQIPIEIWDKIVEEEPEWRHMHRFLEKYGFGRFAVLMVAAGLNDFQLKGKAEIVYWPKLKELLEKKETPTSLKEMEDTLKEFYTKERLPDLKLKRLNRFLSSKLAGRLWGTEPKGTAENFIGIWYELAATMGQDKDAKTIAFAMKCLGISLLMAGESDFSFEKIPIPVDYRVREFTKRLGISVKDDEDVRRFWNHVLEGIRKRVNINMIHLDSLIWQIGVLRKHEIVEYFSRFGLSELGEKIAELVE
ncbi:MAG: N-glycosylase/DNA lyase [Thermoplasmata archaeon]|nr:N-glycosylase/DNA lyase [Thermoplasmata archaeon]